MKTVYVNIKRCVGCRHCELACVLEHSSYSNIISALTAKNLAPPRLEVKLGIDYLTFPARCRHCKPAPCHNICPTGAIYRDEQTDSVLVQGERCISCGMCAMVCPYSAIDFPELEEQKGPSAYKCDDCLERLKQGKIPACAAACRTEALIYDDINKISSAGREKLAIATTLETAGESSQAIPANIRAFQEIQHRMALMGPLPASQGEKNKEE